MRSHFFIHLVTIISFAKPFIFKIKIEKEGLPRDRPAGLGAGGLRFKSGRCDLQAISKKSFPSLWGNSGEPCLDSPVRDDLSLGDGRSSLTRLSTQNSKASSIKGKVKKKNFPRGR